MEAEVKSNTIILADGTILENCGCGYANGSLWLWFEDKSMKECFDLFIDPKITKKIEMYYVTEKITYVGFTSMLLIRHQESDDRIEVRMTWPDGGEHSIITERRVLNNRGDENEL